MKGNKGITLIALVVTIIVLLILAGVAIAMLRGDNGILNRATEARYENIIASFDEQVRLSQIAVRSHITANMVGGSDYIATDNKTSTTKTVGNFDALVNEVKDELGVTDANTLKTVNTEKYTVKYYLDEGSATKDGTGYIIITYSDNSLRSSMPTTAGSADTWQSGAVKLTKATTQSPFSTNEAVLAYVIKVTNYNCELSKILLTDETTLNGTESNPGSLALEDDASTVTNPKTAYEKFTPNVLVTKGF